MVDFDNMKANAKQIYNHVANEGLDTAIRTVHARLLDDLGEMTRPLQMGKIEKAADAMENLFYKANWLSPVDNYR